MDETSNFNGTSLPSSSFTSHAGFCVAELPVSTGYHIVQGANDPDIQIECYGFGICDAYGFAEMPNWPENAYDWTTAPATVTGVAATPISSSAIDVSWTAESATGFRIERRQLFSTSGGVGISQSAYAPTWTVVGTVDGSQTIFHDTGLSTATNYSYRVQAYSALNGTWSSEAQAETFDVAPAAPTNLYASATSQTTIELDWTKNSTNETGFKVERLGSDGSTWTQIALTGHGVTTYTDSGLTQNTSYTYRVRATNSYGDSDNAGPTGATTYATPPTAPTNLSAMAVSTTEIDLSWTDNSNNEQWFYVERSGDGGNTFHVVATVNANQTLYSDTGLTDATTYYYRVRASNSGGNSAYTNVANATTLIPSAPLAPTNLVASAPSNSEVDLTWQDNSNNEDGFTIQRLNTDGTTWSSIGSTPAGTQNYSDMTALPATTYTYRVCAFNGGGSSPWSNWATATTLANSPIVGPSGQVVYTLAVASSSTSINLYWAPSASASSYHIYRSTQSGGPYAPDATVVPSSNNQRMQLFVDTGLTNETAYCYFVTSVINGSESAQSPEASHFPNADAVPLNGTPQQIIAWAVSHQENSDSLPYVSPSQAMVVLPDNTIVSGLDYSVSPNPEAIMLEPIDPATGSSSVNTGPFGDCGGQFTEITNSPSHHVQAYGGVSQVSYAQPGTDHSRPNFDTSKGTVISYKPNSSNPTTMFSPINSDLKLEGANIYIGFKSFNSAQTTLVGSLKNQLCDCEIGFQLDHYSITGGTIRDLRWTPYFRSTISNQPGFVDNTQGKRWKITIKGNVKGVLGSRADLSYQNLGVNEMYFAGNFNANAKMIVGAVMVENASLPPSLVCLVNDFNPDVTNHDKWTVVKFGTGLDQTAYTRSNSDWVSEPAQNIFFKKGHIRSNSFSTAILNSDAIYATENSSQVTGMITHSTSNTTITSLYGTTFIDINNN